MPEKFPKGNNSTDENIDEVEANLGNVGDTEFKTYHFSVKAGLCSMTVSQGTIPVPRSVSLSQLH